LIVIPAKAGIQALKWSAVRPIRIDKSLFRILDSGFRRNDGLKISLATNEIVRKIHFGET